MATPQPTDVAELHEFLVCDICAEPYDDRTRQARFLECLHTFCSQCLALLAGKRQGNSILCPNCRHPTRVPENGIDGLRTNFYIDKLKAFTATTGQTTAVRNTKGCDKHANQPLFFFCETCRTAICRDCTVLDHDKTGGHSIADFSEAVATQTRRLQDRLNASRVARTRIQGAVHQIESEIEKLHICRDSVLKGLNSMTEAVHQQIELGKEQVTGAIMQQDEAQQSTLSNKQLQIQQASKLMDKHITQSEEVVKTGEINEMINMSDKLEKAMEITQLDSTTFDIGRQHLASDMITEATSLNNNLCRFGKKIFESLLPKTAALKSNVITAGLESIITIELLNNDGNVAPIAACFLSIKLTDPWETELPVTLNTTDPELTVTFTPQRSGRHDIAVMYLGQELRNEQNHILVESNNPVMTIGGPGHGNGSFISPRDIVIDNNGCLYVADTGNGLIQKFSSDGRFVSQFRVNGDSKEYTAFTLALDLNKELMICSEILLLKNVAVQGNTVLVFSLEGELRHKFEVQGMSCLLDIAVTSCGNLLITDSQEKCVFKVDKEGNFLCSMADFRGPGDICISDDDTIIVPDTPNNCINILNADGTVRRKFGSPGSGKGQLRNPFGVATDGENILVAEGANNRVQVFRYDGTPVCVIESSEDPLDKPRGLAVTGDGHVYVVDRDNHCVKKYKYMGRPRKQ